ncbi:hypothetical protein FRC11_003898 [Ceratobasidium sp. 423]|nr:hypothetical protein FRC11_003898 [Ceratobasidium sp. 423]
MHLTTRAPPSTFWLDVPPPPVKFNFIPNGGGDDFELEYDSTRGSWWPRSTAQQRDAPISEYTHNTASSSSSQPSQTTPVPAVAADIQVGNNVLRYIQAHIAQLRLIAFERISAIRAAEQAAAVYATTNASSGSTNVVAHWSRGVRRPGMTQASGLLSTRPLTGWWEDDVIDQDHALFTGVIQFAGETTYSFMDDD